MSDQKKRGRPKGKAGGATPRQFRLTDQTLAELDYLQDRLGLTNRTDVIRSVVRRIYLEERKKESS